MEKGYTLKGQSLESGLYSSYRKHSYLVAKAIEYKMLK